MKPNIASASYSLAVGSRNNHSASHNNPTEIIKERNSRFSLQYPEPGSNRHRGEPTGV